MATMGKNRYQATDYDFGNTVTILKIVYIISIILIVGYMVWGVIATSREREAFSLFILIILAGLAALVINYLWYSFAIVLFEIVKNLRQTRDEIMALRKVSTVNSAATQVNAEKQPSGSLRYDPNTHEYIKAQ